MATLIIEQLRQLHEEVEALERAAAQNVAARPKPYKDALLSDLRSNAYVLRAQAVKQRLAVMYADADGALRAEKRRLASYADDLTGFRERIAELEAFHAAAASEAIPPPVDIVAACGADAAADATLASFSVDELYGKYVDLAASFTEWCGLPHIRDARVPDAPAMPEYVHAKCDYIAYLKRFVEMHATLPRRVKACRQYRRYITSVATYLVHLFCKAQPLVNVAGVLEAPLRDFAAAWKAGARGSWVHAPETGSAAVGAEDVIDIAAVASADDVLALLGPDGTRTQCIARGLKAGGTPAERAARLFAVRAMAAAEYPKKFLAAAAPAPAAAATASALSAAAAPVKSVAPAGDVAAMHHRNVIARAVTLVDPVEYATQRLPAHGVDPHDGSGAVIVAWCEDVACRFAADIMADVFAATRRRAERRLTRTREEIERERRTEEEEVSLGVTGPALPVAGEDDDDDGPIYNPLNVPLGWDGKPIPLWLYKLHQLHIEYKCEICGGESYFGRRNFDRHFQEWKHAYHMRMMGIPNTKHFHDITRIEDARALWAKLCTSVSKEVFRADADEEFEDSMGNVLNRKTYEDLARHGML